MLRTELEIFLELKRMNPLNKDCSRFRNAASAIESLCNKIAGDMNFAWLLAVPLLHFLREDSKPFEEPPEEDERSQTAALWGAKKLPDFRRKTFSFQKWYV